MRYYITMWCNSGVECVQDITEFQDWDTANAFALLSGEHSKPSPLNSQVSAMCLRARFNTQRSYEIYVFTSTEDVCEEDIKSWADSSPQTYADWVRKNHTVCLFQDRAPERVVIV